MGPYSSGLLSLFGTVWMLEPRQIARRLSALWARCLIYQASRLMALACGLSSMVSLTRASASANSSIALKSPSISP